ncbi:MAG: TIGR02117 family protein [Pseudomonadota bacterium]
MRFLGLAVAALAALAAASLGAFALATGVGALVRSEPEDAPATRTIYLIATPIHTEIIVPIADDVADWRGLVKSGAFRGGEADHDLLQELASHVAIGWGAESFYLNVKRLSDIRPRFVLDGIWDDSLVHVTLLSEPQSMEGTVSLTVSESGYRRLVSELEAAFARENGEAIPLQGASYHDSDGFFEGAASYSPLVTCNEWIAARLRSAGVSVGIFTPFSQTLLFSLGEPASGAATLE